MAGSCAFPFIAHGRMMLSLVEMTRMLHAVTKIGSPGAVLLLGAIADRVHLVGAGALAGLALLTKQSLFAAALAGTLWLAMLSPRKAGLCPPVPVRPVRQREQVPVLHPMPPRHESPLALHREYIAVGGAKHNLAYDEARRSTR